MGIFALFADDRRPMLAAKACARAELALAEASLRAAIASGQDGVMVRVPYGMRPTLALLRQPTTCRYCGGAHGKSRSCEGCGAS